jgi:hypothetical protein
MSQFPHIRLAFTRQRLRNGRCPRRVCTSRAAWEAHPGQPFNYKVTGLLSSSIFRVKNKFEATIAFIFKVFAGPRRCVGREKLRKSLEHNGFQVH